MNLYVALFIVAVHCGCSASQATTCNPTTIQRAYNYFSGQKSIFETDAANANKAKEVAENKKIAYSSIGAFNGGTAEEFQALQQRVRSWRITQSSTQTGIAAYYGYPTSNTDMLVDALCTKYNISDVNRDVIKAGFYGEGVNENDKTSGTRGANLLPVGNDMWVVVFKLMAQKNVDGTKVDIIFVSSSYSMGFAPERVATARAQTDCLHLWFIKLHCTTRRWMEIKFRNRDITAGDEHDMNTWFDYQLSHRFNTAYAAEIARVNNAVKAHERQAEQCQRKMNEMQEKMDRSAEQCIACAECDVNDLY